MNAQIEPELQDGEWRCSLCTLINNGEKLKFCCVCQNGRVIATTKRKIQTNINAYFGGGGGVGSSSSSVGSIVSSFEIKDKTNGTVHRRKKSKRLEDLSIPQLTKLPIVAEKPLPQDKNITGSARYATKIFEAGGGEISMVEPPKSYHHDNYEYNDDHEDFQVGKVEANSYEWKMFGGKRKTNKKKPKKSKKVKKNKRKSKKSKTKKK